MFATLLYNFEKSQQAGFFFPKEILEQLSHCGLTLLIIFVIVH